ncbi:hypothetical protein DRE_07496 [Drechslerella stenobrocha 248]|uniref:AB hydrolase-1 domain-containing protein n=1 Tax=Drechslerella stenobrocha 248 TaxID=1043628 RepID=W7HI23_9PEZI|nr:hypothetical protein DRE_07496 [Drechslerella stenobrocha 248]
MVSPFSLVRWGGPLGPRFVSGWTSRRVSLPEAEAEALHLYSYQVFKQKGSGEYALTYLLAPEVVFMYGDSDWMDAKAGKAAADAMQRSGGRSRFRIVSNAGHHLYLDNYEEFNRYVDRVLADVERET